VKRRRKPGRRLCKKSGSYEQWPFCSRWAHSIIAVSPALAYFSPSSCASFDADFCTTFFSLSLPCFFFRIYLLVGRCIRVSLTQVEIRFVNYYWHLISICFLFYLFGSLPFIYLCAFTNYPRRKKKIPEREREERAEQPGNNKRRGERLVHT
jgi:hypothetical protein